MDTSTLERIKKELQAHGARLIVVSKTRPEKDIMSLYRLGQRDFAENRVQELLPKAEKLPKDIYWHLIGHLQRNKVKYIVPFIHLIQSVDSFRLLRQIDSEAAKENRVIDFLLQFRIAEEESKYGFERSSAEEMLESLEFRSFRNISIKGVMGMATFTDDERKVHLEFRGLKTVFESLKSKYFQGQDQFCEISMGMSDDYRIALEEGSTMVRIGTLLFGPREGTTSV